LARAAPSSRYWRRWLYRCRRRISCGRLLPLLDRVRHQRLVNLQPATSNEDDQRSTAATDQCVPSKILPIFRRWLIGEGTPPDQRRDVRVERSCGERRRAELDGTTSDACPSRRVSAMSIQSREMAHFEYCAVRADLRACETALRELPRKACKKRSEIGPRKRLDDLTVAE
jgi:hypothetical protein